MEQQIIQTETTSAILCPPAVSGEGRCMVGLRATPLLAAAVAHTLRGRERAAVCYDGTAEAGAAARLFAAALCFCGGECLWMGEMAAGPFHYGWSRGEGALGVMFQRGEAVEALLTLPGGLPLTRRRRGQLNLELLHCWEQPEWSGSLRRGRCVEGNPMSAYGEMLTQLVGEKLLGCCCRVEGGPSALRKLGNGVLCAGGVRLRGGGTLILSPTGEQAIFQKADGTLLPWEKLVEQLCILRLAKGERVALPAGLCPSGEEIWPGGKGLMRYRPDGEDRAARGLAMLHPWVRDGLLAGFLWLTEQRETEEICRF